MSAQLLKLLRRRVNTDLGDDAGTQECSETIATLAEFGKVVWNTDSARLYRLYIVHLCVFLVPEHVGCEARGQCCTESYMTR